MNNEKEMIEVIKKRCEVYQEKNIPVHITKKDLRWMNGFIKEVSADFIMLDEFKDGPSPIFFSEILNVETFTRVSKE